MTPIERFQYYRDRIQSLNPQLNAFVSLRFEEAEADAEASQQRHDNGRALSPIDGWCIGVKANIAVKGMPHHAGIAAYKDVIAPEDAVAVARLRAAGAVILGIVNMHEGALGATTDNEAFGRTQNPWKHGYTPGGSSGGSGSAVSATLCDVALGSDTMGSVRIPSAYCGVQGHKPTTHLVPDDGVIALSYTLDHVGPHARSVDELAAVLAVLSDQAVVTQKVDLSDLRIGIWDGAGDVALDGDVEAGFANVVAKLKSAGASLESVTPPEYLYGKSRRAGLLISECEAAEVHAEKLAENPDGFSPLFRKLMAWGVARPAQELKDAYAHVKAVRDAAKAVFERFDFVIAPTAPQNAFSFDADVPANQADFTAWADFAALPASAVYTGVSENGLPLSCQVMGPEGADARTLSAASALERLFGQPPAPSI
ncbi:amidase [Hirschia litorea]|uniref:Amidase n=1 Tax=Hirschia litorea TaxID=1199156 RepID=A0ABW2IGV1_9PROT